MITLKKKAKPDFFRTCDDVLLFSLIYGAVNHVHHVRHDAFSFHSFGQHFSAGSPNLWPKNEPIHLTHQPG